MTYDQLRAQCSTLKGFLLYVKTHPKTPWGLINTNDPISEIVKQCGYVEVTEAGICEWSGSRLMYGTLTESGNAALRKLCGFTEEQAYFVSIGDRFTYEGFLMKVDIIIDEHTVRLYAPYGFQGMVKEVKVSELKGLAKRID